MNTAPQRMVDWRIVVAAVSPLLWLVLFYSFVLRARLYLGVWPRPDQADPKDLGFEFHYLAIYLGVLAMFVATMWAVALALVRYSPGGRPFPRLTIGSIGLGFTLVIVIAQFDPGDCIQWFLD